LKKVSYAELKSGMVRLNGRQIKSASLSSQSMAIKIAEELKVWIKEGEFALTEPVETLNRKGCVKPLIPVDSSMIQPLISHSNQNPPSKDTLWLEDRCIRCGFCVSICPHDVFRMGADWEIHLRLEECTHCGECADICPVNAINYS